MKKLLVGLLVVMVFGIGSNAMAASFADIAFVVDQSGSMFGEFSWIGDSLDDINTAITADPAITNVNYGVAGYEALAGSADTRNAWQDITGDIQDVIDEVDAVNTYGGIENGYQAADWAADNFDWSGGDYAKVMVLITDEPNNNRNSYSYSGLFGEAALAAKMAAENILLNVITFTGYYQYWDDIAFTNPESGFQGLFNLSDLRTDAATFTADFTAAKLAEIVIVDPPNGVPEPGTLLLFGSGLAGLALYRRRSFNK